MRKIMVSALLAVALLTAACESQADMASRNTSTAADNFEVLRRVVFVNGITDKYLLSIEGYCSRGNHDSATEVTITCKTGDNDYKKHFLGLSDNVTYFIEQLEPAKVSGYHYRVIFRPETLLPDIEFK